MSFHFHSVSPKEFVTLGAIISFKSRPVLEGLLSATEEISHKSCLPFADGEKYKGVPTHPKLMNMKIFISTVMVRNTER